MLFTVQLSGASLASVEVSLTLSKKIGTDRQTDKQTDRQIDSGVCRVASATKKKGREKKIEQHLFKKPTIFNTDPGFVRQNKIKNHLFG